MSLSNLEVILNVLYITGWSKKNEIVHDMNTCWMLLDVNLSIKYVRKYNTELILIRLY
jgi:hypothetical protein